MVCYVFFMFAKEKSMLMCVPMFSCNLLSSAHAFQALLFPKKPWCLFWGACEPWCAIHWSETFWTWFSNSLQALPVDTSCKHAVIFKVRLYGLTGCNAWTYRSLHGLTGRNPWVYRTYSVDLQVILMNLQVKVMDFTVQSLCKYRSYFVSSSACVHHTCNRTMCTGEVSNA